LRFAYADPPYPGTAKRHYGREKNFAGEVDHRELVRALTSSGFDGWALSTSSKALRAVLPLCPETSRVTAWVKPIGVPRSTYGMHSTWEPLIVVPGRVLRPGRRDFLSAQPAKRGGTLSGRKPLAFCAFLFQSLGMLPGDELVDCFPGTGIVSRAWRELSPGLICRPATNDTRTGFLFPELEPSRGCRPCGETVVIGGAYRFTSCCGAPAPWDRPLKHFDGCTGTGLDPKHVVKRRSSTRDGSVRP
jgi:hypothetical protein